MKIPNSEFLIKNPEMKQRGFGSFLLSFAKAFSRENILKFWMLWQQRESTLCSANTII